MSSSSQNALKPLRITVVAANSLSEREVFRFPDPCAVITVDTEQTHTTSVSKKTLNPHWNESFDINVKETSIIAVQIFDQRDQCFLGVVNIRVSDVIDLEFGGHEMLTLDLKKSTDDRVVVHGKLIIYLSTDVSQPITNPGLLQVSSASEALARLSINDSSVSFVTSQNNLVTGVSANTSLTRTTSAHTTDAPTPMQMPTPTLPQAPEVEPASSQSQSQISVQSRSTPAGSPTPVTPSASTDDDTPNGPPVGQGLDQYDSSAFPETTMTILEGHIDEVWNLEWSHSGEFLASASKDKSAIIWRIGRDPSLREYSQELTLRDHPYPVGCTAWSLNDSILLTSSQNIIKLWNAKTGLCTHQLDSHHDTVTALRWLPDDSGFISGALDRRIIIWDTEGTQREHLGTTEIRVTDLAVTPDLTRLVAVGIRQLLPPPPGEQSAGLSERYISEHSMIIYDMATKQTELSLQFIGDLTSVKISRDSKYALINHAPSEIHLWDIGLKREIRTFTGQRQGRHVIRSCFGGVDSNFVASGSEDGNVYVWHRDTGTLLKVLSGHGEGSVNSVAWNPKNERMFASCSDDHTIRIWEALSPGMMSTTAAKEGTEPIGS